MTASVACLANPRAAGFLSFALMASIKAAYGQGSHTSDQPSSAKPSSLPPVVVEGRSGTAGDPSGLQKQVIRRDEILQYGDSNLSDALGRVPSVSVTRGRNRDPEVRLRGLGARYVQILVNGQPAPFGFSIDSVSPALVERVEISYTPSAESSAQTIGGTINIVLRSRLAERDRAEGRLTLQAGRDSTLDATTLLSGRTGGFGYVGALSLKAENAVVRQKSQASIVESQSEVASRETETDGLRRATSLNASLRGTYEATFGRFVFDSLGLHSFQQRRATYETSAVDGNGFLPSDGRTRARIDRTTGRASLTFTGNNKDGTQQTEARTLFSRTRRASFGETDNYEPVGSPILSEKTEYPSIENSFNLSAKHRLRVHDLHFLSIGGESSFVRRAEQFRLDDLLTGRSEFGDYVADTDRMAVFLQGDFDLGESSFLYVGGRLESVHLRTEGTGGYKFGTVSYLSSPIVSYTWAPLSGGGDSIKASLNRGYKLPQALDLTPRRFYSLQNDASSPDIAGNPALQPELSWNLELSGSKAITSGVQLTTSLSLKVIENPIVTSVFLTDARWVAIPVNFLTARAASFEIGGRGSFRDLGGVVKGTVTLTANLGWNWSRVLGPNGTAGRIDQQVPFTGSASIAYSYSPTKFSAGASLTYNAASSAQISDSVRSWYSSRLNFEAFSAQEIGPGVSFRVAFVNITSPNESVQREYTASPQTVQYFSSVNSSFRGVRVSVEKRFK